MLAVFLAACLGAGAGAAAFTRPAIPGWYESLQKPSWTPPNRAFGPVWGLLYVMMAVAAWLVWRAGGWQQAGPALSLFAVQLILNFAWSAIFFRQRKLGAALAEILILWIAVLATTAAFSRWSPAAGWLMVPYLAWLTLAASLNFKIWRMNPDKAG